MRVQGQPGLEFQESHQGYIVRPCREGEREKDGGREGRREGDTLQTHTGKPGPWRWMSQCTHPPRDNTLGSRLEKWVRNQCGRTKQDWSSSRACTFSGCMLLAFEIHGQWRSGQTDRQGEAVPGLSQATQRKPSRGSCFNSLVWTVAGAATGDRQHSFLSESGGPCCVPGPGLLKSSNASESNRLRDLIQVSALWALYYSHF